MVWLCLGSVSKDFAMDELNEILLNYIIMSQLIIVSNEKIRYT